MKAQCIGSSSSGNCYLLQFSAGDYSKTIMVEAGFPYNEIVKRALNNKCTDMLEETSACIITHGHSDHAKAIKQLINNGIDVFAEKEVHIQYKTIEEGKILKADDTTCIEDGINVYSFQVEHDYPNSLGFIISCKPTGEQVLFVNDCKYFTQDLSAFKFDYIFIECNYEDKYTYVIYNQAKKENDKIKMAQYERVIHSHMGLSTTKKSLSKLNLTKTKAIFLMHLSDRNANEYKMKDEIKKLTNKMVLVCQKNGGIK